VDLSVAGVDEGTFDKALARTEFLPANTKIILMDTHTSRCRIGGGIILSLQLTQLFQ
jgi:hypothetical protein